MVLSRSRLHRLVVMAYAGAGLALMANSVLLAGKEGTLQFIALYWPIGFSMVMLAGVRGIQPDPKQHDAGTSAPSSSAQATPGSGCAGSAPIDGNCAGYAVGDAAASAW